MPTVYIQSRPASLLERIVYGLLLVAVMVLGFFFLAAALVAGAILAAVVLARLWWLKRKLEKSAAKDDAITTEYTVVERERISAERNDDAQAGAERSSRDR